MGESPYISGKNRINAPIIEEDDGEDPSCRGDLWVFTATPLQEGGKTFSTF